VGRCASQAWYSRTSEEGDRARMAQSDPEEGRNDDFTAENVLNQKSYRGSSNSRCMIWKTVESLAHNGGTIPGYQDAHET